MGKEKFWKVLAIASSALLAIVVCTSSFYTAPLNADLGDVCEQLHYISSELGQIEYKLSLIEDELSSIRIRL